MILSSDQYSQPRWGRPLVVVGGLHALVLGALLVHIAPPFERRTDMPAIAVEMASPAAIPAPINDAPTPEQIEAPKPVPQEQHEPEKLPFDPPPEVRQPNVRPEVVVPLRTQQLPRPEPLSTRPPAPTTTQAAAPDLMPADINTAPINGGASAGRATASDQWDARIRARIELTKRYPSLAARQDQEDDVNVLLTLNRDGRLLDARVGSSRGLELLDGAALDAVRRAAPFPRPPTEIQGEKIRLSVIVRFRKRAR